MKLRPGSLGPFLLLSPPSSKRLHLFFAGIVSDLQLGPMHSSLSTTVSVVLTFLPRISLVCPPWPLSCCHNAPSLRREGPCPSGTMPLWGVDASRFLQEVRRAWGPLPVFGSAISVARRALFLSMRVLQSFLCKSI